MIPETEEHQTQYVVSVYKKNKETWEKIHATIKNEPLLYDQFGNLNRCTFCTLKNEWLGDFILFKSLDKIVAETVEKDLKQDPSLTILPMKVVEYPVKLNYEYPKNLNYLNLKS